MEPLMKPHLRIIAGRPVAVRTESPQLAKARARFGMATGEKNRKFIHEPGSQWQPYPEPCLSRWGRNADYLNVRRSEAA
jgi:hypothetical protein